MMSRLISRMLLTGLWHSAWRLKCQHTCLVYVVLVLAGNTGVEFKVSAEERLQRQINAVTHFESHRIGSQPRSNVFFPTVQKPSTTLVTNPQSIVLPTSRSSSSSNLITKNLIVPQKLSSTLGPNQKMPVVSNTRPPLVRHAPLSSSKASLIHVIGDFKQLPSSDIQTFASPDQSTKSDVARHMKEQFTIFRDRLKKESSPRVPSRNPSMPNRFTASSITSSTPHSQGIPTEHGILKQLRAAEETLGEIESGVLVASAQPFPGLVRKQPFGVSLLEANRRRPSVSLPPFTRNFNVGGPTPRPISRLPSPRGDLTGAVRLLNERLGPGGTAHFDPSLVVDFLALVTLGRPLPSGNQRIGNLRTNRRLQPNFRSRRPANFFNVQNKNPNRLNSRLTNRQSIGNSLFISTSVANHRNMTETEINKNMINKLSFRDTTITNKENNNNNLLKVDTNAAKSIEKNRKVSNRIFDKFVSTEPQPTLNQIISQDKHPQLVEFFSEHKPFANFNENINWNSSEGNKIRHDRKNQKINEESKVQFNTDMNINTIPLIDKVEPVVTRQSDSSEVCCRNISIDLTDLSKIINTESNHKTTSNMPGAFLRQTTPEQQPDSAGASRFGPFSTGDDPAAGLDPSQVRLPEVLRDTLYSYLLPRLMSLVPLTETIPGVPGLDYPIISTVPYTTFYCTDMPWPGFYADTEARCQVWHLCDLDGRQASFLCPNGTVFNQAFFVCDWWYNTDCLAAPYLYPINERLFSLPEVPETQPHRSLTPEILDTIFVR